MISYIVFALLAVIAIGLLTFRWLMYIPDHLKDPDDLEKK